MKLIAMMTQPIKLRTMQVYICSALFVLVSNSPVAVRSETPQIVQRLSAKPRWQDYLRAKQKAYAWLDQLHVDPVELNRHGFKGKKKLAEILDAYIVAYRYTTDQAEQARFRQRIIQLARHTHQPAYHNMLTNSDAEFRQNRMSYLRILWLLEYIGLDTADYRQNLHAIKSRLDAYLTKSGPWHQAVFITYYDTFELDKPPTLPASPLKQGLIARKLPIQQYNRIRTYHLTHEVFAVFDYGFRQTQTVLTPVDHAYLRELLPVLIERARHEHNADLLAELLSCMTYLGWQSFPVYHQGLNYLLDHQNPTGTWGSNYDSRRKRYGKYLDQNLYLHTTLVVIRALIEAYEGRWSTSESMSGQTRPQTIGNTLQR
jgi:hypothetical protein